MDDTRQPRLKYLQTHCADRWGYGPTDEATIHKTQRYLDSLGLPPQQLLLQAENSPELCLSCGCKTGKVFHVRSEELKVPQYEALGFILE